jgi:hypothetical protein
MPSRQHRLKTAAGRLDKKTEIDMYNHEDGENESCNDMDEICEMNPAGSKDFPDEDQFREHQGPSRDKNKGHEDIDHHDIGDPLQRIELSFFGYRIRWIFSPENAGNIIPELYPDLVFGFFPPQPVLLSIGAEEIADNNDSVVKKKDNAADIMNGHSKIKADHGYIRIRILHAETCDDQTQKQQGIDHMPYSDPYRVQIHVNDYFFSLTFLNTA